MRTIAALLGDAWPETVASASPFPLAAAIECGMFAAMHANGIWLTAPGAWSTKGRTAMEAGNLRAELS